MLLTVRNLRSHFRIRNLNKNVTTKDSITYLQSFSSFGKNHLRSTASLLSAKQLEECKSLNILFRSIEKRELSSHTGWETTSNKTTTESELSEGFETIPNSNDDVTFSNFSASNEFNPEDANEHKSMYNDPRKEVLDESLTLVSQFGWFTCSYKCLLTIF